VGVRGGGDSEILDKKEKKERKGEGKRQRKLRWLVITPKGRADGEGELFLNSNGGKEGEKEK